MLDLKEDATAAAGEMLDELGRNLDWVMKDFEDNHLRRARGGWIGSLDEDLETELDCRLDQLFRMITNDIAVIVPLDQAIAEEAARRLRRSRFFNEVWPLSTRFLAREDERVVAVRAFVEANRPGPL